MLSVGDDDNETTASSPPIPPPGDTRKSENPTRHTYREYLKGVAVGNLESARRKAIPILGKLLAPFITHFRVMAQLSAFLSPAIAPIIFRAVSRPLPAEIIAG